MPLVISVVINAVAIWLTVALVPGLTLVPEDEGVGTTVVVTLVVSLVFGLVNALVRPLVAALTVSLFVVTLGLFTLVVNALMLGLTAWITELTSFGLRIDDFWSALVGGLVISIVSVLVSVLVGALARRRRRGGVGGPVPAG